jgi:hypothetical protein
MKPFLKVTVVAGGYVGAAFLASAVVALHIAATSGPVAQASSGMYAAGDAFLFVGVFGVSALVPTAAGLFFLRPYRQFWVVLSAVALAVAFTAVVAAILFACGRHLTHWPVAILASLSVFRVLVAPLFALTFFVCTVLAPDRHPRLKLLAATVTEVAVSAFGGVVLFLLR